jgi:CARDB protein
MPAKSFAELRTLRAFQRGMHFKRALGGVAATSLIAAAPALAAARPDLREFGLTDPPSQLAVGQEFSLDVTVKNVSAVASHREGKTSIALIEDPQSPKPVVTLGHVTLPRLKAGHSSTKGTRVRLPTDLKPGEYFLWVCPDSTHVVAESNERNNCMSSAIFMDVIKSDAER